MDKNHLNYVHNRDKSQKVLLSLGHDDFYFKGGTYKTNMNAETSKVDPQTKPFNETVVKHRAHFNVHEHHKTALLDENYKEIYDVDFKPVKNSKITNRQSSLEKADP